MCPISGQLGMRGTLKLTYTGLKEAIDTYAVEDVNWTVPLLNPPLRIIGTGTYKIGSPDPLGVLQHRMELDLQVGSEPVEHFDSGWTHIEQLSGIHITVSINGLYCLDKVIVIEAAVVPDYQIQPYALTSDSTFQQGCYDPCDCLLGPELPMTGTFGAPGERALPAPGTTARM